MERVRLGGGNGEREMERGATGRGRWGGVTGRIRWGRGQRRGGEEGARGRGVSQMDMMKCLGGHMECEVTEFSDFVYPMQCRVPQLVQ